MGITSRFELPYPEETDEADVPADLSELAVEIDGQLARAFVCESGDRPTGVGDGFVIWESDTKLVKVWDDATDTWLGTGGGAGGGGGSAVGGTWTATGAGQSIPNTTSGPGTVVAFGTQIGTPTSVTRATLDSGHKFTLGTSALWTGVVTVRWASNATGGEKSLAVWADPDGGGFDLNLAHDGGRREGLPATVTLPFTRFLAAGTALAVYAYNGTGGARLLEPSSGDWVHIDIWAIA